jgi:fatty-acyl-CoA synthase
MNAFVHCGNPLPGFEVEIRDAAGRVLPERRCGALHVRGPSVMAGYFGDPAATGESLCAEGWLDTGDLAYRVGAEVVITGRKKDLIIINGRNIWPQDLEYLTEMQPEIRTGDALAFSIQGPDGDERAVVMVQCRESDAHRRKALRLRLHALIRQELGIDCSIELVPRNTLTRTTSGKPSRHAARREYLARMAAAAGTLPSERPLAADAPRRTG